MRFRIDLKIFIFIILFYFTKQIEVYGMIMIFAMIHELGHLFAGIFLGMRVEKIEIQPFGFSVSFKIKPTDYNKKIKKGNILEIKKMLIALAGPLTNFLIIILMFYSNFNIFEEMLVIYTNILIIIFNMLPVYPLDGGRILKGILHIKYGNKKSYDYINKISFYTTVLLTAISSIAILYIKNIAIFLGIIVIWTLFLKEDKKYKIKSKIYKMIEEKSDIKYISKCEQSIENKIN